MPTFFHHISSTQHSLLVACSDSDRHGFNKYASNPVVPITLRLFLLCEENIPTACVWGEMLYQFHCFSVLLHLPQTEWKGEKWTVVASINAFRPNKARQNQPDKLKMATLGKEHYSLQGRGIPVTVLNYFTSVRFASAGEERRRQKGRKRREGKERCAWIINSPELYMGDKNSGWITRDSRGTDAHTANVLNNPFRWSQLCRDQIKSANGGFHID